jgi:hypothetical protein
MARSLENTDSIERRFKTDGSLRHKRCATLHIGQYGSDLNPVLAAILDLVHG